MPYVLMIFYVGVSISMHDFGDAAACNSARNIALQANANYPTVVKAFCVPKTGTENNQQQ